MFLKYLILSLTVWTISLCTAESQAFVLPITVSDGKNSMGMAIGVHGSGTYGYNPELDIFAPPPPPMGVFDARFEISGEAYIRKIFDNYTDEKLYPLRSQLSTGQQSIQIKWNNEYFNELGSLYILIDDEKIGMDTLSTFEIPNNAYGTPKIVFISLIPAEFYPPDAPVLYSPLDQEIVNGSYVRTYWSSSDHPGAVYEIEIAADEEFTNAVYVREKVSDTTFVFQKPNDANFYWWRVRTMYPAGPGEFSMPRMFEFSVTTVIGLDTDIPAQYQMYQNYPNPFNPHTIIRYDLPRASTVTLEIFNPSGQQVDILVNEYQTEGRYEVLFNASNLSSGVYLYRLTAGGYSQIRKLLLVK